MQHNSPLSDLETDANSARPIGAGGTGATTAQGARTNLGVGIGSDVQAHSAYLDSVASAVPATAGLAILGKETAAEVNDYLGVAAGSTIPSGAIMDFAGSSAPDGWLLCYGQAISRTTYATLYSVIGTTHGSGDGSTTFNLPDCRGRTTAGKDNMGGSSASRLTSSGSGITGSTLGASGGVETVTLSTSQIPSHAHSNGSLAAASGGSHTHSVYVRSATGQSQPTALSQATTAEGDLQTLSGVVVSGGAHTHSISGSTSTAGSGGAHSNTQPTIVFNKIIKT